MPFPQSWPGGIGNGAGHTGAGFQKGGMRHALVLASPRQVFRPCRLPETTLPAAFRAPELDKGHWLLIAALSTVLGLADEVGAPW